MGYEELLWAYHGPTRAEIGTTCDQMGCACRTDTQHETVGPTQAWHDIVDGSSGRPGLTTHAYHPS